MKTIIAYHGKKEVKEFYIDRVKKHRIADELVKGFYWQDGKGCGIGCTVESSDHSRYPIELGIPEMLARLEDCIFEGLPNDESQAWPERFLNAVPVGADLSMAGAKFLLAITKRRYDCLNKTGKELVGNAIMKVISILEMWVETGKADKSAASSALATGSSRL